VYKNSGVMPWCYFSLFHLCAVMLKQACNFKP
jgi:hypothetical protein